MRQFTLSRMNLLPLLESAKSIWLSTHRNPDGDGLGSEVAFYHALKTHGYPVRIVHNDMAPARYAFLLENVEVCPVADIGPQLSEEDVALIFDTHDPALCEPLFGQLRARGVRMVFIDHHVAGPLDVKNASYCLNETASCTGQIVLDLIKLAGFSLDREIASALYASLLFDTQNFKVIRDSVLPFKMAIELIGAGADHRRIHHCLFENWTAAKMNYLSRLITQVSYQNDQVAVIPIRKAQLEEYGLHYDEVADLVDLFMSLKNLQVSIVIREESSGYYKLSFRSRGQEILSWAREFGGGGHLYSAGAWVRDSQDNILARLSSQIRRNHAGQSSAF